MSLDPFFMKNQKGCPKTSFNTTWQSNHPLPFGNELFCCEHPLLKLP